VKDEIPAFGEADLTNCDREPIHIPGSIQPHGAILALEPGTLRVLQGGGDTERLLLRKADDLLGRPASDWLSAEQHQNLVGFIASSNPLTRPAQAFMLPHPHGTGVIGGTVHQSGGVLILELEPVLASSSADSIALVQSMVRSVQSADGYVAACQAAAEQVRTTAGFDRVMVYRFLSDGAGVVEAEAHRPELAPFLGLRYPASDIPQQARELYFRNWVRVIPDINYTPAPMVPVLNPHTGLPLDMSQCALRSVSPIHLEYLGNMGVRASMSLSLILNGKLWGLIACHHDSPNFVSHQMRIALEIFTQMASFILETKITAEELSAQLKAKSLHDAMIASLSKEEDLTEGFTRNQPLLLDYIPSGGVSIWMDGHIAQLGTTPTAEQTGKLVSWLNTSVSGGVYHTDALSHVYPPAIDFKDVASGILALSVSREPRDYVIWFRPEIIQTVTWAGNPRKSVTQTDHGPRLSPRRSFAAWQEQMRQRSEPWSNVDIQTAQTLRVSLLEVVLLRLDQIAREKEAARARQEELLAELDARILQWEATAGELKREGDRRAVVEAELSQVLRRTVIDQENERRRIARELHDSLGQLLTIMQMDLDDVARRSSSVEQVRLGVTRLKQLAASVGHEINRLASEIRPTSLDDLGLQTAMQQFLEEWSERSGLALDLHLMLDNRRLSPEVETTLYRVLQEAITNVVKHAEATKVGIILEANDKEVRLIVEDNGKGFDWEEVEVEASPSVHLGLLGIRERLALIHGHLEIEAVRGGGTTLIVRAPLWGTSP
jgi:two-component system, chemotaxis family, sensor kinase Cph1